MLCAWSRSGGAVMSQRLWKMKGGSRKDPFSTFTPTHLRGSKQGHKASLTQVSGICMEGRQGFKAAAVLVIAGLPDAQTRELCAS